MYNSKKSWFGALSNQGFPVQAVTFDGTDFLVRISDLTDNADGKTGTISFWVQLIGAGGAIQNIYTAGTVAPFPLDIQRTASNKFEITLRNSGGTVLLSLDTDGAYSSSDGWIHVAAAWDVENSIEQIYINGVSAGSGTSTNGTIRYINTKHSVAATTVGTNKLNADLAEFYFNNEAFIDLSNSTNMSKFIKNGKPANLGDFGEVPTGSAPRIYLSSRIGDAASAIGTNKGDGGDLTVDGTPTIATTSPSD